MQRLQLSEEVLDNDDEHLEDLGLTEGTELALLLDVEGGASHIIAEAAEDMLKNKWAARKLTAKNCHHDAQVTGTAHACCAQAMLITNDVGRCVSLDIRYSYRTLNLQHIFLHLQIHLLIHYKNISH